MKHHKTPRWAAVARAIRPRDLIHRERYAADPQYRRMCDIRKANIDDMVASIERLFWMRKKLEGADTKEFGLDYWINKTAASPP